MKWKRIKTFDHTGRYKHWIFEDRRRVLHMYQFHPEFWLTGCPNSEIKTKDEWQYTLDSGSTWYPVPKELTSLKDKQAYVHTLYRMEAL